MKYQKYPAQTIKVAGDLRQAPATFENPDCVTYEEQFIARMAIHKSKCVGELNTLPEWVFITDLFFWIHIEVGLGWGHTLDSSMFVTDGRSFFYISEIIL